MIKTIPEKKKCKKAKWLSKEALQIAEKRREEAKGKAEKERYTHLNAEFQRIARRDKKAVLSDQYKETEENKSGKDKISSRKLEIPRESFIQRFHGRNKVQKWLDLIEAEDIKKRWQEYTEELYKNIFMTQITTMV